jgi:uncharacterized protein
MLSTTIFVGLAGSHAYGTSGPHSDIDVRGICIAPLPTRLSLHRHFEQFEGTLEGPLWAAVLPQLQAHETAHRSLGAKVEAVIYDIAKFLELCARANPTALEILFADQRDWLYTSALWHELHKHRQHFLTNKLQATYLGYALGQLKKIRLHRGWLLNPPKAQPTREEYGLPGVSTFNREQRDRIELAIADKLRSYGIDDLELPQPTRILLRERLERFMADTLTCDQDTLDEALRSVATASLQLPAAVVQTLQAERRFRTAQRHWDAYRAWQRDRNPARAELERRFGYDTKHAAHLLRLLETGVEIIQTGELRTRRQNAAELVAVIGGALTFDQLVGRAAELEAQMSAAMLRSTLPDDVDHTFVDELLLSLVTPR